MDDHLGAAAGREMTGEKQCLAFRTTDRLAGEDDRDPPPGEPAGHARPPARSSSTWQLPSEASAIRSGAKPWPSAQAVSSLTLATS